MSIIKFRKTPELFPNRKDRIVRTEQLWEQQIFNKKKPNAQVGGGLHKTAATTCRPLLQKICPECYHRPQAFVKLKIPFNVISQNTGKNWKEVIFASLGSYFGRLIPKKSFSFRGFSPRTVPLALPLDPRWGLRPRRPLQALAAALAIF